MTPLQRDARTEARCSARPSGLASQQASVRSPTYAPGTTTTKLSQHVDRRTGSGHLPAGQLSAEMAERLADELCDMREHLTYEFAIASVTS